MSTIDRKVDFPPPLGDKHGAKLLGHLKQMKNMQLTAADDSGSIVGQAEFDGQIEDIYILINALPGTGESMVYDVLVNGSSILTGAYTVDATTTAKYISLRDNGYLAAAKACVQGDVVSLTRDYTAGTPTPIGANSVVVEYSDKAYKY